MFREGRETCLEREGRVVHREKGECLERDGRVVYREKGEGF